jgi:integrase/recombinase XerC
MNGRLRSFARSLDARSVLEATRQDVERYIDGRRGRAESKAISSRTTYQILTTLHSFYLWAIMEELTTNDPTARIRRPKMRRTLPRPIRDDDLALALGQASPEMKAMLLLAAYAGLRCQEIAGLECQDVFDTAPPKLRIVQGKGGHERVVPLHPEVLDALTRVMPRAGPIFRRGWGNGYSPPRVSKEIGQYFAGLGIDATAHQLRHWFGTNVYAASHDIRLTQELMGHVSPNTTAGYVAWAVQDAAETVAGLHVGGGKAVTPA